MLPDVSALLHPEVSVSSLISSGMRGSRAARRHEPACFFDVRRPDKRNKTSEKLENDGRALVKFFLFQ